MKKQKIEELFVAAAKVVNRAPTQIGMELFTGNLLTTENMCVCECVACNCDCDCVSCFKEGKSNRN